VRSSAPKINPTYNPRKAVNAVVKLIIAAFLILNPVDKRTAKSPFIV
jgi:hypothetical protein